MDKINVYEDCGNAPKKVFLKDFVVSIVLNEKDRVSDNITDDISWDVVGGKNTVGKSDVLPELMKSRHDGLEELTINTIVTHGYDGVVEGELKFKDRKTVSFCDIFKFSSPRNNSPIKAIKTYSIS